MGTGHAAGIAAHICVREHVTPRSIDGARIRKQLLSEGVDLDEPCDGYWKELREADATPVINSGDFITLVKK